MARRPNALKRDALKLVPRHSPAPRPEDSDHPARWARPHVRTIAITGGQPGVGRSQLAANLAVALGERGANVLLVDLDLQNGGLDLLLGVHPRHDLNHWLTGDQRLDEIVVQGPKGVRLVPAGSSARELAELDDYRRECLLRGLGQLEGEIDLILLDIPAGTHSIPLALAADQVMVLTTPELPAYTDAYALVKELAARGIQHPPGLIVSMSESPEEAAETAHRIRAVARRFLQLELAHWGEIPLDPAVPRAARLQEPVVMTFPDCPASGAYRALAAELWPEAPEPQSTDRPETPLRLEA